MAVEVLGPLRVLATDGPGATSRPTASSPAACSRSSCCGAARRSAPTRRSTHCGRAAAHADPLAALQTHVFRVRRALSDGIVASSCSGYQLDAARVDVDADAVLSAVVEAQSVRPTDPAAAVALLDAALARWRNGPPVTPSSPTWTNSTQLERLKEWRVRAIEERAAR